MRVKNLTLAELEERVITIGFVDENLYTQVRIDCKELFDEHPDAIPSLAVQPPQGDAYPAVVTRDGDIVVWNVTRSDVQYANLGRLQLTFVIGEIVAKSYVGKYVIDKSIMPDGEAPTPIENWITEANAILGEIPGTITEAVDTALTAAKESGEFDGDDGFSPMVTVEAITGGHRVTVTDAEGDHPFDVPDGEDGDPGHTPVITASKSGSTTTIMVDGVVVAQISDGQDGDPGHSPVITASKSGKTTTISVDGTPIATINDGEDGGGGENKADKTDTVLNTTLSRGRTPNSTVGDGSIAFGNMVEASGSQSVGFGYFIEAKGNQSFAHGYEVVARGARSSAGGYGTIAQGVNSDVSGMYNVTDSYENWPDWQPNTFYDAKAKIHLQVQSGGKTYDYYYICNTPHTSGTTWDSHSSYWDNDNGKMNYAHIVGNGKDYRHRSNAYALDWEGNGHYAGDVYVGCNADGSGGVKIEPVVFATDSEIQDIIDEWEVSA